MLIEIRKIPVDDDGNGQSKDEDANEGAKSTDELEIHDFEGYESDFWGYEADFWVMKLIFWVMKLFFGLWI